MNESRLAAAWRTTMTEDVKVRIIGNPHTNYGGFEHALASNLASVLPGMNASDRIGHGRL